MAGATGGKFSSRKLEIRLTTGAELWFLIHLEVQAKREATFPQHMWTYYHRIVDRYDRPVVSMAILCDASPSWRPTQYTRELLGCRMQFTFLAVKLLDYQSHWSELEASPNPFATVVMTHLKAEETRQRSQERKQWKFQLIRGLYEKGYGREEIINLFLFIDWLLKLPQELEQEVWEAVKAYEEERAMPYVSSVERIGIEKGRQEGLEAGAQNQAYRSLLRVLHYRFESIPAELQSQLEKLPIAQLEAGMIAALTAESLAAFVATLAQLEQA